MKTCSIAIATIFCLISFVPMSFAQKEPPVPCNGTADNLPGRYTDHTNTKYASSLKGPSPALKSAMQNQLIAIEKLEEKSRTNFQLNGCFARVSFSGGDKNRFPDASLLCYGYQLGVYQNVCHVTEHVVKTVDEYRTVLRVTINPAIAYNAVPAGGTGEFYLTDKNKSLRYDIPVDAKQGPNYVRDRDNQPSRVSRYVSEQMILASRSSDYKNKHADFLKIINGDGYVENWLAGSPENNGPKSYKFIDRRYLITRPGIPILVPVTRKQFLEDMLEYFEIEKVNFFYDLEQKVKDIAGNTSETAQKRAAILAADRIAYPELYEAKKARVKELLATQSADWLQQPAVVDYNNQSYDAYQRLANIGKFYDAETDKRAALYVYNPAYFNIAKNQPAKPVLIEVQLRYELGYDRGFSERFFSNFVNNFDIAALQKMLQ